MYRFSALALAMSSNFERYCLPCRRYQSPAQRRSAAGPCRETRDRGVVVFMDNVVMLVPAGGAVDVVIVIPIGTVAADNAAAVPTADVILIKTVIAERMVIVPNGIFPIDSIVTVVADYGQTVSTASQSQSPSICYTVSSGCSIPQLEQIRVSLSLVIPPFQLVNTPKLTAWCCAFCHQ